MVPGHLFFDCGLEAFYKRPFVSFGTDATKYCLSGSPLARPLSHDWTVNRKRVETGQDCEGGILLKCLFWLLE